MEWSYCIYDEEWIVDGIVCLGKELVAVYLEGVPIGLVMCCNDIIAAGCIKFTETFENLCAFCIIQN